MKNALLFNSRFTFYGIFILILGLLFPTQNLSASSEKVTTLFLVRHAEKASDGSDDPVLAEKGRERADELMYILKHVKLDAIYSTPYRRTQQTALPTAKDKNLKIQQYKPGQKGFLDKVLNAHSGGSVLIVGHSNTIPLLANELLGDKVYDDLADTTYDNLFIAYVQSIKQTKIIRMRFGAHTPEK